MTDYPIGKIKVTERHRKDLGNLKSLAENIDQVGLLHPVVIHPGGRLIAGQRRLQACRLLGWTSIPVTEIDITNIAFGEFSENFQRKDFLPSEIDAIRRRLEPVEKVAAKKRQSRKVTGTGVDTRDKIGAIAGVSGKTVDKIREVCDAAQENPEEYGKLVEEMDRTGKVTGAYRKLKQSKDQKRILDVSPIKGQFRTLVLDPPWDYEWLSLAGRAAPGYATMSHEQLLEMKELIDGWGHEPCHMYLWTTNNFLTRAVELMEHWGFAHKTVLTWVKPKWGLGSYFRNSTEQCLFGVKGEQMTRRSDIATHFEAPVGEHSAKPDIFYDIVSTTSYPPFGEAFQRKKRPGFKSLYELKERK